MALRGNLKDFSLPDVFQLVTFSRKTGVLRISREDGAEGSVWFREGDVFFAQSNWHTEMLGDRLVRAQRITPQALERALGIRGKEGEGGRRLGQILVDEGYITDKVLEAFVQEQIQETIFDLMRWDEGEFDFEAMPEAVEEDIGLSVSIENVIMEGSRRLEEWNRIKKKIPSTDVVFKMATAPGEGTFEISLKPIEWNLLLLVDATRSVADLALETNRTDFEVARIIYGLFSAGLLEFASDEEIERLRAERREREAALAQIEAARRAEQEVAAAAAQEAAPTPEAPAERGPVEEPQFLGGAPAAPSADDMAVLQEMMGAVLEQPVEPQPVEQPPTPTAEPYVPGEEPAFISKPGLEGTDLPLVPVPSVEELLADLTDLEPQPESVQAAADSVAEVAAAELTEPIEIEVEPAWQPPAVGQETWVPPAPTSEAPEAQSLVEPSEIEVTERSAESSDAEALAPELVAEIGLPGTIEAEPVEGAAEVQPEDVNSYERELMALGLGELPADLLGETAEPIQEVVEPLGEREHAAASEQPEQPVAPVAEPVSITADFTEAESEIELEELQILSESLDLPVEVALELPEQVEPEAAEEVDFSDLLESLDISADDAVAGAGTVEPAVETSAEPDFDADLLRDEAPVETGGVISTDAFLEDITIDADFGYGGMDDELSALTGADRPSRPTASVNKILDAEAEGVLHRDTRVDKDTLLKIIDGIKNL